MNFLFNLGRLKVSQPRQAATEKYDFPVLTMYPTPTEPKGKCKFELNEAAMAMFKTDETTEVKIACAFRDTLNNKLASPVLFKDDTKYSNLVNKTGGFFDKGLHEDICEFFGLGDAITSPVEFKLDEGYKDPQNHFEHIPGIYNLIPITQEANQIDACIDPLFLEFEAVDPISNMQNIEANNNFYSQGTDTDASATE